MGTPYGRRHPRKRLDVGECLTRAIPTRQARVCLCNSAIAEADPMFTLKLYTHGGSRRILEVERFHITAGPRDAWFEISAYFDKPADDPENAKRFDVGPSPYEPNGGRWDYAFIENSNGRTTEKLWPLPSFSPADDHKPPMTTREIVEAEG